MKILNLRQSPAPDVVNIDAEMEANEFKQLGGELDNLRLFALKTLTEDASVIQTGARKQFATYWLFPKTLRWRFKTDRYDFKRVKCGAFTNRDKLYVVYEIPKKGLGISTTSVPEKPRADDPRDRLGSEISKLKEQFSPTR